MRSARSKVASHRPPPESWVGARDLALRLIRPLESFLGVQAASGIVLLIAATVAMAWANSPWKESYHALWHVPVSIGIGSLRLQKDLLFLINDGLMVVFFFVVGLEIRRELHAGELSELKRASLPLAAAVGGMIAPALIYASLNAGTPVSSGWGVPMATDIAFAVGVLTLLGSRVPAALRVLLLALAIIDDIGAILVIALFYSGKIEVFGLVVAGAGVLGVLGMQRLGVRQSVAYVVPGVVLWVGLLETGVHPTIAGVVVGLLTPPRSWFGDSGLLEEARDALGEFSGSIEQHPHERVPPLQRLQTAAREAVSPVVRLEVLLHPWVAFGVMPLFALANAGVTLSGVDLGAPHASRLVLGVAAGLLVGKPVGIVSFCWLATRLGVSSLPRGVDWRGVLVVGLVGGIGFTMALFIAQLAFASQAALSAAKLAVLCGSLAAGVAGLIVGFVVLERGRPSGAALTVTEAEASTEA